MGQSAEYITEIERFNISILKEARSCIEELGLEPRRVSSWNQSGEHELPPGTADHYTSDQDVMDMLELGEALEDTPWGASAKNNRAFYIAGTGHVVTAKPKYDDDSISTTKMRAIQRFLNDWMNESGWNLRQAEVSQRNDVYGESIDTLIFDPDGMMRVQFGESEDLLSDPDSEFGSVVNTQDQERVPFTDEFGVRRSNDAKYRKLQFFLGDQWYPCIDIVSSDSGITLDAPSIRIDRTEVQLEFRTDDIAIVHRTRGLRSNDNRGRTFYFPIREELVYAKRIIANVMRVSSFQAAFGAIRTLLGGNSADALKCWARQQENASSTANSDTIDVPAPGVLTTTSNVKWEFPDTGAGLVNHMEILAGVLRTCASGANMPEFMLTADVSAGNFSSTLVSEGPFHKSMQWEQSQMIAEDIKVYMAALRYAAQSRKFGFSLRDLRNVRLDVRPPRVQTRNRQEDFDIASTLNDKGYLSAKTLTQSEQYDYESEQAQRAREIPVEQPLPLGSALHSKLSMPGPLPGKNGDPMKEPGVSKGNPEKIVKV